MISRETYVEGLGIVAQSEGNLYTNVEDLKGRLISQRNEAHARIKTAGKENIGKTEGTRVSMLVNYLKEELPVWQRNPRFSKNLAKLLVNANSKNKYYSTGSTKEYEQVRKIADAEEKKGIDPKDRSAIICPSRKDFEMSLSKNSKQLYFILQDLAEQYLQLNGQPIKFLPIDKAIVNGNQPELLTNSNGTIISYSWFRGLDLRSELYGSVRDLFGDYGARGVFKKSGEATSPKILKPLYTQRQITTELNRFSRLEKEIQKSRQFLESLKQ